MRFDSGNMFGGLCERKSLKPFGAPLNELQQTAGASQTLLYLERATTESVMFTSVLAFPGW